MKDLCVMVETILPVRFSLGQYLQADVLFTKKANLILTLYSLNYIFNNLTIDKGSPGGAVHSAKCNRNHGS